jgi:hypothetical protein
MTKTNKWEKYMEIMKKKKKEDGEKNVHLKSFSDHQ